VVVAVVGLIQKSGEIRIESNHRITARAIINRELEQRYRSKMFNALSDTESADTVTIDSRTGISLYGNMSTKTESGSATCAGNMEVPVKKVTISVSWNEYNEAPHSVSVSRWLVP